ncbi:MAG TPA: cobalt ECF transporter T component CbiQ [Candidatus Brocadiia bacterium]|nr:cobalt ECF transporter T component CbiQ [Candidatus Brocadiia bacterium]
MADDAGRDALMDRLDPRARVAAAFAFSVLVAVGPRPAAALAALAAAGAAAAISGLRARDIVRRLAPVGAFLPLIWLTLPFTRPGQPVFRLGPLAATDPGLRLALLVTLKALAVTLALVALLGRMDLPRLGHALHHLRVPDKLVHLLLMAARYVDVLRAESARLASAMKARAFRPRASPRTFRAAGYLAAMILIRGFDRAARVHAAMKLRGFRGRFYVLSHFAFARRDLAFCAAAGLILGLIAWMQWTAT